MINPTLVRAAIASVALGAVDLPYGALVHVICRPCTEIQRAWTRWTILSTVAFTGLAIVTTGQWVTRIT